MSDPFDFPPPTDLELRDRWVPIRTLTPRHRQRMEAHLLKLPPKDRQLRFGHAASDSEIHRYVAGVDFQHDAVLGIFNRWLDLVAVCHLAYAQPGNIGAKAGAAELGVSVLPHARGRGYGRRLFNRAALHARNHGVTTLFIQALSENDAMLHIARSAGAIVTRNGAESSAWLELPDESLGSRMQEALVDGAAELNYSLKVQARRFRRLLKTWGRVGQVHAKPSRSREKGPHRAD